MDEQDRQQYWRKYDHPLLRATILRHDYEAFLDFLDGRSGAPVLNPDAPEQADPETGGTPLLLAADLGFTEFCEALIERKALVDAPRSTDLMTPFLLAVRNGHFETMEALIDGGCDKKVVDIDGRNAVHLAAREKHSKIISFLLRIIPEAVHELDANGQTPLMFAAGSNSAECVKALLEAESKLNTKDKAGMTALAIAAQKGCKDTIAPLIEARADLRLENKDGYYPLMYAAKSSMVEAVHLFLTKLFSDEISRQSNIDGMTPLMWAARTGNLEILTALLKAKSEKNMQDIQGNTAVILAAKFGREGCLAALLTSGAHHDQAATATGNTALHWAELLSHSKCAELLLESNAKATVPNKDGETPLLLATRRGATQRVLTMLKQTALNLDVPDKGGVTPLLAALMYKHEDIALAMLDAGASVLPQAKDGMTAIMWACQNNLQSALQRVVDKGANANATNTDGNTGLILASWKGHTECVRILLAKKVDVNCRNVAGMTALLWACRHGYSEVVQELMSAKADPNVTNTKEDYTAVMWAAKRGSVECLSPILDTPSANLDYQTKDGWTALMLAAKRPTHVPNRNCTELLLKAGANRGTVNYHGQTAKAICNKQHKIAHAEHLRQVEQESKARPDP